MKKLAILLFCLLAVPVLASHIVGGEFELLHVQGQQYRLNLIYYFDEARGDPANKLQDRNITVRIYRFSDNVLMRTLVMPFVRETAVAYSQPACSEGELRTSKQFYSIDITLSPGIYNDPKGYFVIWERCCRNYSIQNIVSRNPNGAEDSPSSAGQTFYLHFPPVVKNGKPFIDSTPNLFPPLSDYACPVRPYYTDFRGVDNDGDSLAYSLVTPYDTHNHNPYPFDFQIPAIRPIPEVRWVSPFSLAKIMGGHPDLKITNEGFLTVMPGLQGIYVFAVKVEQYRDGEKIGESRRDFQMLVTDGCLPDLPPQIMGKTSSEITFTHDNTMSVSFSNTIADQDRCIQVRVSDPEASNAAANFSEHVSLKIIPLNFKDNTLNQLLPATSGASLTHGSTANFSICFPQCPYLNGPYQVGIIAFDDACSLPLSDTLKVTVNVQPPPNTAPYFTTPVSISQTLHEGAQDEWPFEIRDDEQDSIVVSVATNGFLLADAGMKLTILFRENGLVKGKLSWDAYCSVYDFTKRTNFEIKLLAEDTDHCELPNPVASLYKLSVLLPGNADPLIYTDLGGTQVRTVLSVERKINESLSFNVFGSDTTDHDALVLDLLDKVSYSSLSLSFPKATGNTSVQSQFLWNIKCDELDLSKQDQYTFHFVVVDNANLCRLYKADTLDVQVKVLPPDNAKPDLSINNLNPDLTLTDHQVNMTIGQQLILGLQGYDADLHPQKDALSLNLIEAKGNVKPEGYSFTALKGQSPVSTTFVWNPGCTIFQDGVYENEYTFTFRLADNNCYAVKADTVTIHIKISDVARGDEKFTPVNFFSPNDDGVNDYYSMEIADEATGKITNTLPPDNCTGAFEAIRVYNRWGKEVFKTTDRNFKWYAKNEPAGVYYYTIIYTNREYKGALTLRY